MPFENILSFRTENDEKQRTIELKQWGGVSTEFSMRGSHNHPGFFTPFSDKFTVKKSVMAIAGIPAIKMQSSVSKVGMALLAPFFGLVYVYKFEFNNAIMMFICSPLFAIEAAKYIVSALFNFLKELVALFTRSIATLLSGLSGTNKHELMIVNEDVQSYEVKMGVQTQAHLTSDSEINRVKVVGNDLRLSVLGNYLKDGDSEEEYEDNSDSEATYTDNCLRMG